MAPLSFLECSSPLGLQSGKILDNQISSSSDRDSQHSAHQARLHGNSAWCSARSKHTKFLQIDFRRTTEIVAVATQGHPNEYKGVYKYKLKYSFGNQWLTYKESRKEKVFKEKWPYQADNQTVKHKLLSNHFSNSYSFFLCLFYLLHFV